MQAYGELCVKLRADLAAVAGAPPAIDQPVRLQSLRLLTEFAPSKRNVYLTKRVLALIAFAFKNGFGFQRIMIASGAIHRALNSFGNALDIAWGLSRATTFRTGPRSPRT